MKCHIIGNGQSRNLFESSNDFKICLNVYSYPCDLLFAVDEIAIKHLEKNNFYETHTVINDKIKLKNEYIIDRVPAYRRGIPFALEEFSKNNPNLSFNVGHCAYQWARKNNYTEIHLWGFDIFFKKNLVSLSDEIFGHTFKYKNSEKFKIKVEKYLKIWNAIIDSKTYIHMPHNEKIMWNMKNKNVKGVNHGIR